MTAEEIRWARFCGAQAFEGGRPCVAPADPNPYAFVSDWQRHWRAGWHAAQLAALLGESR